MGGREDGVDGGWMVGRRLEVRRVEQRSMDMDGI